MKFTLSLLTALLLASSAFPQSLSEHQHAMVVVTSGKEASRAGLRILQAGGTAADAAASTALTQIVECGGAYVSAAGIFTMTYFEAATGETHYLNAGFNTVAAEDDPLSIPKASPGGRTALVPGFLAGIDAALSKFGKLQRKDIFESAIQLADKGFILDARTSGRMTSRKSVLSRLPEARRIFLRPDGDVWHRGDLFVQKELAQTLKLVSENGSSHIYTGDWARAFVEAVQREGGKITLNDMAKYQPLWQPPILSNYREFKIAAPGFASRGGVTLIEAMNLLELADIKRLGPSVNSAESFLRLAQIGHLQTLSYMSTKQLSDLQGRDLSPESRVTKETSAWIWSQMASGKWPGAVAMSPSGEPAPEHSDGIVVVDAAGNVAAVTHTINTLNWGETGLFVDGISIPDAAAGQPLAIQRAGPGNRLPDPTCPLIVLENGKPVLGSSTIGSGLHQLTLHVLCNVLDFRMDPHSAANTPGLLRPDYQEMKANDFVEKGRFPAEMLHKLNARGLNVHELTETAAAGRRGYWVGIQLDAEPRILRAGGSTTLPVQTAGY